MTPNQLVRRALLAYPTLYQWPVEVLAFTFTVIGNGYEWNEHGELQTTCGDRKPIGEQALIESVRKELTDRVKSYKQQLSEGRHLERAAELHHYEFVVANIDHLSDVETNILGRLRGSLYPCCREYAKILTVPDNATTAWVRVAYWFLSHDMLPYLRNKENCSELTESDKVWLVAAQQQMQKLDDMLIARGVHSTREEREALMRELAAEIKAEEQAK